MRRGLGELEGSSSFSVFFVLRLRIQAAAYIPRQDSDEELVVHALD